MKPHGTERNAVRSVICRLRELIAALDRRTPRPERTGEQQIAAESEALREEATKRIAELETGKTVIELGDVRTSVARLASGPMSRVTPSS
jgi:hypothetical protein